jgi:hypothetical protein
MPLVSDPTDTQLVIAKLDGGLFRLVRGRSWISRIRGLKLA